MFEVIKGGKDENHPTDLTDAHFNIYDNTYGGEKTWLVVFEYLHPNVEDYHQFDHDVMKNDLMKLFGDGPIPDVQPLNELDNPRVMSNYRSSDHPVYVEELNAISALMSANIEPKKYSTVEEIIDAVIDKVSNPIVDPDDDLTPEDFHKPFQVEVEDKDGNKITVTRKRQVLGGLVLVLQSHEYPYEDMRDQIVEHFREYLDQVFEDHENIAYVRFDVDGYIAKDVWR